MSHLKKNSIKIESNLNDDELFDKISSVEKSTNNDLSFFSNIKYLDYLKNIQAKACIIQKAFVDYLPTNCEPIIVENPYYVLAHLSNLFSNNQKISNGVISKFSSIDGSAILKNNIQIDSFSTIDKNTEIMNDVIIGSNSRIGPNVKIYSNSIIHDNVSISNAIIAENCEIKSGARIGGAGFGFEEKSKQKIYHNGNVIINKFTTIGSNTTIDRAVFDSTIIGEYSQIDNLVQVAHNVVIGKHAIIAAQVGIAGSTKIGDNVKIGGQAGIAGHLKIDNNVSIAGKSGVTKDIGNNKIVAGFPAKDIKLWKTDIIKLNKLK